MKTLLKIGFVALLCAVLVKANAGNKITGESNTQFGKYSIESAQEVVTYKNEKLPAYRLCYDNCSKPVLIGVQKTDGCKNFIVTLDDLQIVYTCKKGVFGVGKKPKQKSTSMDVNEAIDAKQFTFQKIITQKSKTEEELLGLIACYYPSLIKSSLLHQDS